MSFPADGRVNYSILEKEEMKDEKEKQVDWNSGFKLGKSHDRINNTVLLL